jgi:Arc/MetJ-type ribon-helix-helix transcriptional regulator
MSDNITISLPKELYEKIEKEIKNGNFDSKTDFFRFVLRRWRDLVNDDELSPEDIAAIERGRDDIKHGRVSSHARIMEILKSKK